MGVLNCQKCFNNENKNKNEIITGNNLLKNQKVLFALDSRKSTLSPRTNSESTNQNKINHFFNNKEKYKKISIKSKKFSNLEDEYMNELDYNTIEIPNDDDDEDSQDSIEEKKSYEKSENVQDSEENYKKRLKNAEELFGCSEESSNKNSNNIHTNNNSNNNINQNIDNNININDEIKNTLDNKDKCDLNDFINEKIKEKRINELILEEKKTKDQTLENNSNEKANCPRNYNIIIGNNCLNYNYQYNLYNNNFNDMGNWGSPNSNNYINQQIDEENEEYEQEKKIIDISDINNNDININKYKSSTFSQNYEKNEILDKKNSVKSEEKNTRKGTKNEGSNEFVNYNFSNNYQPQDDRSAISYEIEYIDDNNNFDNDENNKNIIIGNNEEMDINNGIDLNKLSQKQKKRLNFIENIEQKLDSDINKIRENHNQYIITDAFCDYEPEI